VWRPEHSQELSKKGINEEKQGTQNRGISKRFNIDRRFAIVKYFLTTGTLDATDAAVRIE
jgi:hypothetical protein